jgi:hypothetical protein
MKWSNPNTHTHADTRHTRIHAYTHTHIIATHACPRTHTHTHAMPRISRIVALQYAWTRTRMATHAVSMPPTHTHEPHIANNITCSASQMQYDKRVAWWRNTIVWRPMIPEAYREQAQQAYSLRTHDLWPMIDDLWPIAYMTLLPMRPYSL